MKKAILIPLGILCLFITSCTTVRWTMGMPETTFKSQSHQIKVVEMGAERNVYAFQTYDSGLMYFYFSDGKLIQVDHGETRPDMTIQVNRGN